MTPLRRALAALVAATLLSACQDDPEPKVADPTPGVTTSAPEPSPSPSPNTSTSGEQPEAVVRGWVTSWNQALASGDTTPLRDREAPSCRGCDEIVGPLEQIAGSGGRFEGGTWTVVALKVVNQTDEEANVNLAVDVAAGSTTPSSGAIPTPYPPAKHLLKFTLSGGDPWQVSVIELLS